MELNSSKHLVVCFLLRFGSTFLHNFFLMEKAKKISFFYSKVFFRKFRLNSS